MAELDTDRIAAAALRVADAHGADGFTMRAVAEALRVTPMALYHHVEDKSALVALVVDRVIAEQPLPPPTGDWREDLWEMTCWLRRTSVAHPAVARAPPDPSGVDVEHPPDDRALVQRLAAERSRLRRRDARRVDEQHGDRRPGRRGTSDRRGNPARREVARFVAERARSRSERERDGDAEFELVVHALIEGLHSRLLGAVPAMQGKEIS